MISTAKLKPEGELARPSAHLIASIRGALPGPTLIILGGIHGNEPAGVLAAERVWLRMQKRRAVLRGEVVLLRGNTRALERRVRYIDADLNRQWTTENVRTAELEKRGIPGVSELLEQRELLAVVREAVSRARGEIYFVDLHTTSAHGQPFATVGDTLRNRRFALNFPLTIVLGLEEQIDGTLLEYVNNLGAITMGVEAGQHEAMTSVDNHEAVIWIATAATGNFRREDLPELDQSRSVLKRATGGMRVVEVRYRHAIVPEDCFKMEPGFTNFETVRRGRVLARDRAGEIKASETILILMPLYQALGDDGFFLVREVKRFWLRLSALLRKLKVGHYMHLLPGVRRDPLNENFLTINTRIARILPLQIFHLLGFRRLRWTDKYLVVSRRSYDLVRPTKFVV
ncbi:MAG TPA: succinylglutamate desuccinylase/aspartoacylase family protein [Pyrinomonadaceae bacterium]|jgi:succinylglutamate desuccinylase|nr:succinylglutamate desuccinylase/aspartoacylase family protein [Pyrinomonadaceae bacterium]